MLFKLAPLLLSSLFFSYVAGIPVHGSNPATAGAGASGVSAGGADPGREEIFEEILIRGPIKENTIYNIFESIMYVIIAPTKTNKGIYVGIKRTDDVQADPPSDTVIVDLQGVKNAELGKYSAIMKQQFTELELHSKRKVMKQEIAAQARAPIMNKYRELFGEPSPGPSRNLPGSDSESESEILHRTLKQAGFKLKEPELPIPKPFASIVEVDSKLDSDHGPSSQLGPRKRSLVQEGL